MNVTPGLISCVIPTFNRWDLVYCRLLEIQVYKNLCPMPVEVIVVDDGSESVAPEKVLSIIRSNGWKLTRLYKNSGCVSIPRNIGIVSTTGEYIMHIDDDVINLSSKFWLLPSQMTPDVDLVYGGMLQRFSNLNIQYSFIPNYNPLSHGYGLDNSQIIYRRSVYTKIPIHFSRRACDWVLASKIFCVGKISGYNMPVSQYVFHSGNRTRSGVFNEINPIDFAEYFSGVGYSVDFSVLSGEVR